jgi:hypothetical protein
MNDETAVLPAVSADVAPAVPRRRMRGLRLTAVPSWPLLAQWVGGVAVLSGVYLKFGLSITLIVGGVAALAVGMLAEGGLLSGASKGGKV